MTAEETNREQPTEQKSAEEFAFDEMAKLIAEKEAAGVEMQVFIRQLEEEVAKATRRLDVAKAIAGVCLATKVRKPRSDKGKKRGSKKPANQDKGKPEGENTDENCT